MKFFKILISLVRFYGISIIVGYLKPNPLSTYVSKSGTVVTVIVTGTIGTVSKELVRWQEELEIKGRVETTKTIVFMRSAKILRKVLETWEDMLSLRLQLKPIS